VPSRNDLITIRKAVDTEAFIIGRAAAKANAIRRVSLLQRKTFGHIFMQTSTPTK